MHPRGRGGWRRGRQRQVNHHHHIIIVWRSGEDVVICFHMPAQTEGTAYSVVGGGVICQWRRTLSVAEEEAKREVGAKYDKV